MIAFAHAQNLTNDSNFTRDLQQVAYRFYSDVIVVSVDVDEFTSWSNQFVPKFYGHVINGSLIWSASIAYNFQNSLHAVNVRVYHIAFLLNRKTVLSVLILQTKACGAASKLVKFS